MVNMDQLTAVNKKKKGYEIWLKAPVSRSIPVSAGYRKRFEQAMQA